MKSRDLQSRLLYPAKLSFRIEGQIKSFPDKQKLEFIITKLLFCEKILRDLFKKKKNKIMNNKMAKKKHIYEQLNLKDKLSKHEEQRQNH